MSKRFTKLIAIFAAAMAVLQVSAQVKQEGKNLTKRGRKAPRRRRPPQAPPGEGMSDRIQWFVVGVIGFDGI